MLKKIFLVHHTHMDIGYTDLPLEVMDQHLSHLDQALCLCRKHKNFRWTIESAYLVRDYLLHRDESSGNELLNALRNGQMELQAFETQPLTEILDAASLYDCLEYAIESGRKHGFKVKSAMINDIGGYAGRMPTVLEQSGIKYLTAGTGGFQVHLPWADLPHLFYLKAKDGARTLIWNLGIDRLLKPADMTNLNAVYGLGALCLILPAIKEYLGIYERGVEIDFKNETGNSLDTAGVFAELEKRLQKENYPCEEILLQYGGDNRGPAAFLPELLAALNATGKFPEIELTTPTVFFEYMEKKYGLNIPELSGVIADPWNIRTNPTPSPLKKYRAAQRICRAAEIRASISGFESDNAFEKTVKNNLQLYGDHTCGLSEWNWQNSFGADGCRGVQYDRFRHSWKAKAFYADAALDGAMRFERSVKKRISGKGAGDKPSVLVWNDSPASVSGPVEIYFGRDAFPLIGLTRQGRDVPFQSIAHNRYLLSVEDAPPFGCIALQPRFAERPATFSAFSAKMPETFETECFKAGFNPSGAMISLKDVKSNTEFLDRQSNRGLGEFIYQQINDLPLSIIQAGMKISHDSSFPKPEITYAGITQTGPVATEFTQRGNIPNTRISFERRLRVFPNLPRIDVSLRLNKPENEKKECCHIAFPFAGKTGHFVIDQNIGAINPADDLLPGSMQDAFYCSSFAAVASEKFSGLVCCPDAPLMQAGAITTAQWLQQFPFSPSTNHLYSQIYHNLLNTDCPVWQDILDTFNYQVFIFQGNLDPSMAKQCSDGANALSAEYCPAGCAETACDYGLEISPESVKLLELKQCGGKLLMRLENCLNQPVNAAITINRQRMEISLAPLQVAKIEL